MQASEPLLIRTKQGESRGKVCVNKLVSLLERGDAEKALHQADGDDFRIREGWRGVGRTAPVGQPGVGFKEVIDKAVDFGHLVYNGRQMGRPPGVRLSVATPFYTPLESWRPSLSTQYSGLVREWVKTNPLAIAEWMGTRLSEIEVEHYRAAFQLADSRIAALLLELANEDLIIEGLTHKDLALRIGLYRETVTNTLGTMKYDKLIKIERERITILDKRALQELSEL